MDRTVEFEPDLKCDNCTNVGAYDFMGFYLCEDCAITFVPEEEEYYERADYEYDKKVDKV